MTLSISQVLRVYGSTLSMKRIDQKYVYMNIKKYFKKVIT